MEDYFIDPSIGGTAPALIQTLSTFLFCAVFLFLWRQSGVLYFGFWSVAWAVETLALTSSLAAQWSGRTVFLWLRAVLEFFFALSLLWAASSASTGTTRGLRSSTRSMLVFPGLLLVVYLFLWRLPLPQFRAMHAAILAIIYGYSFLSIGLGSSLRRGIGGRMLRFTLACLFLQHIGEMVVSFRGAATWTGIYDVIPQMLLAFSAMAMWIQSQQETIVELRSELAAAEQSASTSLELDHLTGLQSRSALDRLMDRSFTGVVAVCDLDYFKGVNDRFGHLVGDEVLRHVGNLVRASIRAEDEAFRWGGDEFVILFHHENLDVVRDRMAALQLRLMTFRLRGHGLFPLGLSWGVAETGERALRPALEQADHQMYTHKRHAHAKGTE